MRKNVPWNLQKLSNYKIWFEKVLGKTGDIAVSKRDEKYIKGYYTIELTYTGDGYNEDSALGTGISCEYSCISLYLKKLSSSSESKK